jgi:acetoin utilization deacetylase AcuC-like enzyme
MSVNKEKKLMIAWDPIYAHPLPEGHRFPMSKYDLIPGQLQHEGTIYNTNLFTPAPCPDEVILLTHDADYLERLNTLQLAEREQRHIGFPQSEQLVHREKIIAQGTIDCCTHAIEMGVSLNVAGGTHHAFADHGEGFCLLNDFAVAANHLMREKRAERIIIIDLDVHQGNGTASLFANEPRVFTLSMHGAQNYPFHKEISDLDIPLKDGTDTDTYLALLEDHLEKSIRRHGADFAFFLSGVDILETDKFGKLKVTMEGCKRRDEFVFETLKKLNIPVVVAMGGGYSPDTRVVVEAHCQTFRMAKEVFGLE